jgi:acetoin utilization deacetylase AcuC-like enzyme
MHCFGEGFFPGTGDINENDEKCLNIPFGRGREDNEYMCAFDSLVKPFIEEKKVDIIVVSNGLDAHKNDHFQVMKLTRVFYEYIAEYLKSLNKPLIYILEGGYNPSTIGQISENIINVLVNNNSIL